MLSVALVGAGAHGTNHHAPALRRFAEEHPEAVALSAVCDPEVRRAEGACAEFGFARAFATIDDLMAEAPPDAAVLTVPVPAILSVARRFLQREIPVLIEKPMGSSLQEARTLVKLAGWSQAPVALSLNRRFDPGLRLALEWARERGPIRALHGSMLRSRRTEPEFVWSTGIHLLDAMCFVAGPLILAGAAATPESPGGCSRLARLAGPDGIAAMVEMLPACGRVEERLRLAGDDYCVDVWTGSMHPWRVEGYQGGKREFLREAAPDEPAWVQSGAFAETEAFLGAVLAGRTPENPRPEDAWASTELAAALSEA